MLQGITYSAWLFFLASIFVKFIFAMLIALALFGAYLAIKIREGRRTDVRFDTVDVVNLIVGAAYFWMWIIVYTNWGYGGN